MEDVKMDNENEVLVPDEITQVIQREGITGESGVKLVEGFAPLYTEIKLALTASAQVVDRLNVTHQKVARTCRLELRRIRSAVEDRRKTAKADALRWGKAVDGMSNVLKAICEPEEARLEAIEKHAEIMERERIMQLVADRSQVLAGMGVDPAAYNLPVMDDATFDTIVESLKRTIREKAETEARLQAERVAREAAEAAERERLRAENARLEAEAKAQEAARIKAEAAKIQAEREAKAKLAAERKAREAAEEKVRAQAAAEAQAKAAAEAEKQAQERARMAAAAAPDRDKLHALAEVVRAIVAPTMATAMGKTVMQEVMGGLLRCATWIDKKAGEL
jgi:hypothetical protein